MSGRTLNGMVVPSSARLLFAMAHPDLTDDQVSQVEEATRQWFRISAARRRTKLAQPSTAVAELNALPATITRGRDLQLTFKLAQKDERTTALPLLFRVDREIGFPGGRRYLADCGGRGQCYETVVICVAHLVSVGRAPHGDYKGPDQLRPTGEDS